MTPTSWRERSGQRGHCGWRRGLVERTFVSCSSWLRLPSSASSASPAVGSGLPLSVSASASSLGHLCRPSTCTLLCGRQVDRQHDPQFREEETASWGLVPSLSPGCLWLGALPPQGRSTPATPPGPGHARSSCSPHSPEPCCRPQGASSKCLLTYTPAQ